MAGIGWDLSTTHHQEVVPPATVWVHPVHADILLVQLHILTTLLRETAYAPIASGLEAMRAAMPEDSFIISIALDHAGALGPVGTPLFVSGDGTPFTENFAVALGIEALGAGYSRGLVTAPDLLIRLPSHRCRSCRNTAIFAFCTTYRGIFGCSNCIWVTLEFPDGMMTCHDCM